MNRRFPQLDALKKKLAAVVESISHTSDAQIVPPAPLVSAQPWESIRESHPRLAGQLDELAAAADFGDVDRARIAFAIGRSAADSDKLERLANAIQQDRSAALVHPSKQRNLPGSRFARHNLLAGQVRLGEVVPDHRSDFDITGDFGIDLDVLRTSMLVIGPPGSGKTRGIAPTTVGSTSPSIR
jgi:hypothetical protein